MSPPLNEDGSFAEPTNQDRSGWALAALTTFADLTYSRPIEEVIEYDLRELVSDLLCDLRHLCDAAGVSYREADLYARGNYVEEVLEGVLPLPRPDHENVDRDAVRKLLDLSNRVADQLRARREGTS